MCVGLLISRRNVTERRRESGNAMLEFAVAQMVIVPLFFGVLWGGITLGRSTQIAQLSRDVAHMYARSVDFSPAQCTSAYVPPSTAGFCNQDIVVQISQGLDLRRINNPDASPQGRSVVILSQIYKVHQEDCDILPEGTACTNLGYDVFTHRVVVGRSGLRSSNFGTPSGMDADGRVTDPFTNSGARASNFGPMLSLQVGETAFVVEAYYEPDFKLIWDQPGVYTYSIF
ncbi:MAG: hypothetical protein IPM24_11015 [Bryobacterales bacterium]|nr:hypothetical protein [Bryobacterales bacterium]